MNRYRFEDLENDSKRAFVVERWSTRENRGKGESGNFAGIRGGSWQASFRVFRISKQTTVNATLIRTMMFTRVASSSSFYTVDIVLTRLHRAYVRTYVSSLTITRLAYTPYAHICTRIYVQIYGRACMRDFDAGVCACRVATGMFLSAGKCLSSCRCILIITFFILFSVVSLENGRK